MTSLERRLGEDRATSTPPSPPSPRNANVFLQNGAAHRIPIQNLTRTVENLTQGVSVWWPRITREKDKAAEGTEMPTCAALAFPEGGGEGSQIQKGPCLFRATLSVEHLYRGFQALKKLVEEVTGKQGLGNGSSFHGESKATVQEGSSRMNGWRCWAVGGPSKEEQGLGTKCKAIGVGVVMGESGSPV